MGVIMKNKISVYNEHILQELKSKFPDKWEKIDFVNKEKWLTKEDYPTYKQLVKISEAFHIPFGYLFLEKIPEKKLPITHYRTFNPNTHSISDELFDTIIQVKKMQEWIKDILLEWGHTPLPYAGKYNIHIDKQIIVNEIKKVLKLESGWAEGKINWKEAFDFLVNKFEETGIFVVINGVVGNNTHRKLEVSEFRGFVLYDEIAPFVFINNNDFESAKIFTLIHELVHILIGQTASFDLRNLLSADNEIEKFCDRCAAEFLVPENELKNIKDINYENLARQFKVSQIVIARRLLDMKRISKDEFFTFYNDYAQKQMKTKKEKSGGNFYNTTFYRYRKKLLYLLNYAVKSNTIMYRDFYKILNLKISTAEIVTELICKTKA